MGLKSFSLCSITLFMLQRMQYNVVRIYFSEPRKRSIRETSVSTGTISYQVVSLRSVSVPGQSRGGLWEIWEGEGDIQIARQRAREACSVLYFYKDIGLCYTLGPSHNYSTAWRTALHGNVNTYLYSASSGEIHQKRYRPNDENNHLPKWLSSAYHLQNCKT